MRKLYSLLVPGVMWIFLVTPARADPPRASHDHWRNTGFAGHYVLYDSSSRTWVETVSCRAANRFTIVRNETNSLTLLDAGRGMTMRLDYQGMWLKAAGAVEFSFYQAGTFDTRTQFKHVDGNGTYTGAITKGHACSWVEWFPGASGPAFQFMERGTNPSSVELYDRSRDLWVRLDTDRMWLKIGTAAYGFFKSGRW